MSVHIRNLKTNELIKEIQLLFNDLKSNFKKLHKGDDKLVLLYFSLFVRKGSSRGEQDILI